MIDRPFDATLAAGERDELSPRTATLTQGERVLVKEISCINAGFEDCEFLVRSEDEEEVVEFARRHAERTHGTEASREHLDAVMVER